MKKIYYSRTFLALAGLFTGLVLLFTALPTVAGEAALSSAKMRELSELEEKAFNLKLPFFSPRLPSPEEWEAVAPGLDLITLVGTVERPVPRPDGSESQPDSPEATIKQNISIVALRIDPSLYSFQLYSSAVEKNPPKTATAWAESYDLTAAINASMYTPAGNSTGYMRLGDQELNQHIAKRYGNFFVANPRQGNPTLPVVDILDKSSANWQKILPRYDIVVQNFRLFGPKKENLWPMDGPEHAVAAVGIDKAGKVYFLHCASSVNVYSFTTVLLSQAPEVLNLRAAMYVEGGSQAALVVNSPGARHTWLGAHPADIFIDQTLRETPLPNVLGVRKK